MSEEKLKHFEFIQNVITRMNTNSFQIKGFAVTIVTGFLAIYAARPDVKFIFLAIGPAFIFWMIDAYYLMQEKRFRGLFNDLIDPNSKIPVFTMSVKKYTGKDYSFFSSVISKTIIWIYLSIIIGLIVAGLILVIWYSKK